MAEDHKNSTRTPLWRTILEIVLVFVVFFAHGAWPVPDHNETHYLSKAAHFWNPDAFANDFFCSTADAHDVFYFIFGWLTLWLPLDAVAWIGRSITWLLMAVAWRGLSAAVLPRPWTSVLTAELFMLLSENTHMAGEWIVGGVEAKGFAYVFVLWALHALVRNRWNVVWLTLGAATLLHAIVGGWAAICAAAVWIVTRTVAAAVPSRLKHESSSQAAPALASMLPGLVAGLLLAMPGLWLAASLNWNADSATLQQGINIQVYDRLAHHLAPTTFRTGFIPRHLLLWALFGLLCTVTPADSGDRRLRWFVTATMALSTIGLALGCLSLVEPNFAAHWLRFYWMRLSDVIVPLGVSLIALQFLVTLAAPHSVRARWWIAAMILVSAIDLSRQSGHLPGLAEKLDVNPRADSMVAHDDWREVCAWAAANTPPGTRFITPRLSNSFKWYTGRDEVVTWKDMPQDADNVVKWWQRLVDVFGTGRDDPYDRWHASLAEIGLQRLRQASEKYQADYAIVELAPDTPRLPLTPVFESTNRIYVVYALD